MCLPVVRFLPWNKLSDSEVFTMANEYLIKKWRLWFKFIDMKHKGEVSKEDFKEEEEAYAKAAHLEGECKKEFMEATNKFVDELIFHGRSGPITEDDFIELTNNDFKNDKEKFGEKMKKGLAADFKIWDRKGAGSITEEDCLIAFKSVGLGDETWIKKFFETFNPVDGQISLKSYVDKMLPFLVSEDSSVQDPVLELFESYPEK